MAGSPGPASESARLAVEYAAAGKDEVQLQKKIAEFFAHDSKLIWVVRLLGPRRVEVYRPDGAFELKIVGEQLTAPGILRNPVPVLALFDRATGHKTVLRNLLQREGYENLDAVRMEGWKEGQKEGQAEGQALGMAETILAVLESRLETVDATSRERIRICRDLDLLRRWAIRAANVRWCSGGGQTSPAHYVRSGAYRRHKIRGILYF